MIRAAFLLLFAMVLLIGCNSQEEGLVGRWVCEGETLALAENGRFVSTLSDRTVEGAWTAENGQLCATYGDVADECVAYELEGDRLTVRATYPETGETVELVYQRGE